jgi:hypothetical protein
VCSCSDVQQLRNNDFLTVQLKALTCMPPLQGARLSDKRRHQAKHILTEQIAAVGSVAQGVASKRNERAFKSIQLRSRSEPSVHTQGKQTCGKQRRASQIVVQVQKLFPSFRMSSILRQIKQMHFNFN